MDMDEKFALLELDPALPPFDGRIVYLDALVMQDDPLGGSRVRSAHAMARINVDWKEMHTDHVFKADLPGVRKEDVEVRVENEKRLIIRGKRKMEEVQKTKTWHLVDRSSGPFMREFWLPENANTNFVTAKLETGVLCSQYSGLQLHCHKIRISIPRQQKLAHERPMSALHLVPGGEKGAWGRALSRSADQGNQQTHLTTAVLLTSRFQAVSYFAVVISCTL